MDKKVTLAQLKEVVQEAYDQVKTNTGGKNADYIPYLANVNKDLFGISVCLLNGQTIKVYCICLFLLQVRLRRGDF